MLRPGFPPKGHLTLITFLKRTNYWSLPAVFTDDVTLDPGRSENIVGNHSFVDSNWQNAILTPIEVAEELSLEIGTVRDLMRKRILPATKVGGSWRTTRRALYEYLENQMGLESGFHAQRPEDNGRRLLQVQGRRATVDKRRKGKPEEPEEIFFPR